jgi:hypothetical protein
MGIENTYSLIATLFFLTDNRKESGGPGAIRTPDPLDSCGLGQHQAATQTKNHFWQPITND